MNEQRGQTRQKPLIGITVDVADPAEPGQPPRPRAQAALTYSRAVTAAGGVPMMLSPLLELIPEYIARCDGFVFTGGDDPRMEPFGEVTHPKATPLHPIRQEFEIALLDALSRPGAAKGESGGGKPVLGVCLGMQLMALHAGGKLNQHMPDDTPTAGDHVKNAVHRVKVAKGGVLGGLMSMNGGGRSGDGGNGWEGEVTSHHRQAVRDAGVLRVVATAHDGVIEAIDDPARPFYLGVQWHPERTQARELGAELFEQFVRVCVPRG